MSEKTSFNLAPFNKSKENKYIVHIIIDESIKFEYERVDLRNEAINYSNNTKVREPIKTKFR